MAWIRPVFIALNFLGSLAALFSRDRHGQFEIFNLIHFHRAALASPDVAMIDAAQSTWAVWQLIGGCLVLLLHVSAWHLVWWFLLGLFGAVPAEKWLVWKVYGPKVLIARK